MLPLNNIKYDCAIVLNSPSNIKNIDEPFIIAADGGYKHVIKQNKKVDVLIGDLDSLDNVDFKNTIKLNPIKNSTDGQECLDYAIKNGYKNIAIYGVSEGRLDHIFCNLSLLAAAKNRGAFAYAKEANCTIYYLEEGDYTLDIEINKEFSLIAYPQALVSNSCGMQYSFNNLLLEKDNLGRGVSNKAVSNKISFSILSGNLFLIIND